MGDSPTRVIGKVSGSDGKAPTRAMDLAPHVQSGAPFRPWFNGPVTLTHGINVIQLPSRAENRDIGMQVPNMTTMKRILLVDDHPLIRKGLRLTLESERDFMVCGETGSADEALILVEELDPDIIILDISLPGTSGLEVLRQLDETGSKGLVLVVSRHDEILYAERAIRAGARGYVMKSEPSQALISAIRKVLSGGIHVSSAINERLLQGIAAGQQSFKQSPSEALSTRELEVFEMTGRGMGTREIANRLELSIKTVESYRARIKMKLNLANAAELVQHAVQWCESGSAY